MQSLSVAEVIPQLYISITTLAFNLLLWLMAEQKGMRHFPSGRPFYFLVVSVFVANVLSSAATLFQFADTGAPGILVSALQALVYLSNALVTYFFSVFFIGFISEKKGRKGTVPTVNRLLLALLFIIVAGWFAWSAPQMIRTGEARIMEGILLVISAWVFVVYYMLYCVAYLVINRRFLMRRERSVIALGLVLTVVFTIAQGFVGPVLQVNFLGGTLGLMILYFSFYADAGPVWRVRDKQGIPVTYVAEPQDMADDAETEVADTGEREDSQTHTAQERKAAPGSSARASAIPKGHVRKRSIIGFIFAIISALILGSYVLVGILLYRRSEEMFLGELKDNALNNAKTIAAAVDAAAFSRLYDGCQGNEDFNNVLDTLCLFRDNAGLQYVYTTWYDENGIPVMCVDSDPVAPGDMGDALGYAEATHLALAGTPAVYDTPVTDDWGAHLSAFAPIIYEGEVYGAVGVDLDYTWVSGQLRGVVLLIVIICAVCFAVTLMILLALARYLKRKFRLLNSRIDVLSYDAQGLQKIGGLDNGDEFEMIAEHINEVFEKNMSAQQAEAEKLRSAMSEVERRAEEKVAFYAEQAKANAAPLKAGAGDAPAQVQTAPEQRKAEPEKPLRDDQNTTETYDALLPEIEDGLTKEEAIRRVKAAAPRMLVSYRNMTEILKPYFGALRQEEETDPDLPGMDTEELQELYEAIGEFSAIYDADGISGMLRQTEGYALPEKDREKIARIRECVKNSDWTALQTAINE